MQISKIVGQPGRFILHRGRTFLSEGWLLEFKMWLLTEPKNGVLQCTVDFGSGETYIWLAQAQVAHLIKYFRNSSVWRFVVSAQHVVMPDVGSIESLVLHALVVDDKFIQCYELEADAKRQL